MNPRRQVRRAGVRPSYRSDRPTPIRRPRSSWQLPVIRVAWVRVAIIAILLLALLIVLGRATRLQMVRFSGNHSLTNAHLLQLANQALAKQWFGHNTLLVNGGALVASMEAAEPGIKQASVHRAGWHVLAITITERQPTLNWKTGGAIYLLDATGAVIGPTGGSYATLPVVTDSNNLPVKVGDRVAPSQFVDFCSELAKLLPPAGVQVASMTVPVSTSELYVVTTSGLTLKFDTTRPAGEEVADLQQVLSKLASVHAQPTQYIDLRIAHKAYYK